MEIPIQTPYGTFIVPDHKTAELYMWLERNAVKAGQQRVIATEQTARPNSGSVTELLHE